MSFSRNSVFPHNTALFQFCFTLYTLHYRCHCIGIDSAACFRWARLSSAAVVSRDTVTTWSWNLWSSSVSSSRACRKTNQVLNQYLKCFDDKAWFSKTAVTSISQGRRFYWNQFLIIYTIKKFLTEVDMGYWQSERSRLLDIAQIRLCVFLDRDGV